MREAFWRIGVCAALGSLSLSPGEASAKILLITTGDTVTPLGKIPIPPKPEAPQTGKQKGKGAKGSAQPVESPDVDLEMGGLEVAYHWSYGGVFWIDFWTWGGEYCVLIGDKEAVVIPPDMAAKLLGRTSPPSRPFLYKFPLGLLILGGVALVAVARFVINRRRETRDESRDDDLDQYRVARK